MESHKCKTKTDNSLPQKCLKSSVEFVGNKATNHEGVFYLIESLRENIDFHHNIC